MGLDSNDSAFSEPRQHFFCGFRDTSYPSDHPPDTLSSEYVCQLLSQARFGCWKHADWQPGRVGFSLLSHALSPGQVGLLAMGQIIVFIRFLVPVTGLAFLELSVTRMPPHYSAVLPILS